MAVSCCPESTSLITTRRGDPSGGEMRLIGKGWITHCHLLGKAKLARLRLAIALSVCDDPGGSESPQLESDHCLS